MKKLCAVLLVLALALVPILTASTNAFADSKIVVTGEGEICLIPDTAIVSVGVESLNESLIAAQTENSSSMNALVGVLKELGVLEENIKTKGYNVYQRYDYTQGEKLIGYQVSNYLEFKTKDVDNVGSIISKLMENGANRFSGVTFTLENSEEAYKQALSKALENAKNKASALYGGELEIKKIIEEKNTSYYLRDSYGYANSISETTKFMKGEIKVSAETTKFMKGEIKVSACIKVEFEYEDSTKITSPEHIEEDLDKETGLTDNILDKDDSNKTDNSTTDKSTTDKSTTDKSTTDKSTTDKSTTDKSTNKKSA